MWRDTGKDGRKEEANEAGRGETSAEMERVNRDLKKKRKRWCDTTEKRQEGGWWTGRGEERRQEVALLAKRQVCHYSLTQESGCELSQEVFSLHLFSQINESGRGPKNVQSWWKTSCFVLNWKIFYLKVHFLNQKRKIFTDKLPSFSSKKQTEP